ncbi:N-acetylmuramoyl-L-alanine amidase [Lyngbya aestuarii]|uniref:N-acetylmuramoyl-L-alanine amidase n=1 Tax=Lyngbya aestuarii TaxID=118322 RepID=UPI00403D8DD3
MKFRWLLLLPSFLSVFLFSSAAEAAKLLSSSSSSSQTMPVIAQITSGAQLRGFQVTRDGFFLRTRGGEPTTIKVRRSRDGRTIEFDLEGTTLLERLNSQTVSVNRYGVSQVQFSQVQTSPALTRVTLSVNKNSPDWQASVSNFGGIVILPLGGVAQTDDSSGSRPSPSSASSASSTQPAVVTTANQLAEIESVGLANNATQLLIVANQKIRATSSWDTRENVYRIKVSNARLASGFRGPQLDGSSPIQQVRVRQQKPDIVEFLVRPNAGVQIGELNQPSERILALSLQWARQSTPTARSIPVPPPERERNNSSASLPRVPRGRIVVVVDPGHGGQDPGAIGIGGLQEKDIILPIAQQVATLLEQQGIQAVLTRDSDYFVDLAPRVAMAERVGASLFVSIHANSLSLSRPDVNGLETYYFSSGVGLARTIHNSILQSANIGNRGVRQARFFVLRKTSMPAVLVEVGYVTGNQDAARLSNPASQRQMAEAIARGVLEYIRQNR